jgi:hypothetical protein
MVGGTKSRRRWMIDDECKGDQGVLIEGVAEPRRRVEVIR